MTAGSNVSEADKQGIEMEGGTIKNVEDFQYLWFHHLWEWKDKYRDR